MRRADRLIELIGHLKGDALTTAANLAERLEVSVRTVYRDIAALAAQGFPIEGEAGVGYTLRGPVDLPPLAFDHDELEAMALGLAYVGQVGDPALVAAARTARAKIDGAWAGARAPSVSERKLRASQRPERRAPAFAAALRGAVRTRRRVRFRYRDGAGRQSERLVRPLALTAFSDGWLLIAWCEGRRDFRVFRLDRMTGVALLGEGFDDEPGRDLKTFLMQRASR